MSTLLKELERAADALVTADVALGAAAKASGDRITEGCLMALESSITALIDALQGFIKRERESGNDGG